MIRSQSKPELHFGYAKLCFHDENLQEAFYHISEAAKVSSDMVYKQWYSYIALKEYVNNSEEAQNILRKLEIYLDECKSIENYWALMVLALKDYLKVRIEIELPHYYATQIKKIDNYYGYLAFAEIFLRENNTHRALKLLNELIQHNPSRPEAYAMTWEILYKTTPSLEAAEDLMTRAFVRVTDCEYDSYILYFSINLAKVYSKLKKFNFAFELLQEKFVQHPQFTVYLYHYGRLCVKASDSLFVSSGIGALVECLRICDGKRQGKLHYWLGRAYLIKKDILEANENLQQAVEKLPISSNNKLIWARETLKDLKSKVAQAEIVTRSFARREIQKVIHEASLAAEFSQIRIIKAEAFWMNGQQEEAVRYLSDSLKDSPEALHVLFALARYLKKLKRFEALNSLAKKMVKLSRDPQMITTDWMASNIWYARCKSALHKPDKALPLLQCLAKVFPPLPQYEVPYTKYLVSGKSSEDFLSAAKRAGKHRVYENEEEGQVGCSTLETSFDEHNPQKTLSRREFTNKYLEDSVDEGSFEVSNVLAVEPEKYILSHKSFDITLSRMSDRGLLSLAQGALPTGNRVFIGFSVSSEIQFLYYIGKICMDHDCNFDDGLCAIQDFITLTDIEKNYALRERAKVKGLFVKSFLLISSGRVEIGKALFLTVRQDMEKLGLAKKLDYAKKCLSYL
jgi:tetratricopeptide (TPR) repeat protein